MLPFCFAFNLIDHIHFFSDTPKSNCFTSAIFLGVNSVTRSSRCSVFTKHISLLSNAHTSRWSLSQNSCQNVAFFSIWWGLFPSVCTTNISVSYCFWQQSSKPKGVRYCTNTKSVSALANKCLSTLSLELTLQASSKLSQMSGSTSTRHGIS